MTLDDALDYLYSFINYETDASHSYTALHYNLERTARLLELWGNPQLGIQCVHVAGTKGKGSVCAMVEALLAAGGMRTGRFTSPHLDRVNERIAACGRMVDDRELIELIAALPPLVQDFPPDNLPTTFELLTAMALRYFQEKQVSCAVMECGMGGRFDATNVVDPLVAVITAVSYDHMDKLGSRIEQIAAEKAGIIKPGRPVVLGIQPYPVGEVFSGRAAELGSPLYEVA
ncbi:MAG: bifunctional folylpolyglutamate synthase/dihydrofolate synthase, partial [Spirochaetota bacterium]